MTAEKDKITEFLFELASRFRLAIIRSSRSAGSLATLRNFPYGACGDASLLLAKYLQVNGCGSPFYVFGKRGEVAHAWLNLQGHIVDITADQFEDQDAGVIVTTDSPWHSSFDGKIHGVADFCLYDRHSVFELLRAYEKITQCLKKGRGSSTFGASPLAEMSTE